MYKPWKGHLEGKRCPTSVKKTNYGYYPLTTLPESNIAPENGWLEYEFPFGMAYFQGRVD